MLKGYESAEEAVITQQHLLRPLQPGQNVEEFRNIELELQTVLRQIAALEIPEQQNCEDDADDIVRAAFDGCEPHVGGIDIRDNEENPTDQILSEDEYQNNVRCMNVEQRLLFTSIRDRIRQELENEANVTDDTLKLFVTGGAGSGKTFILKMIVELIKRGYTPTVNQMLKARFVEVAALTGVAARLVNGRPLHSTFSLAIERAKRLHIVS